jgi:hypothetical protein
MRSAAVDNLLKTRPSNHATPHNAQLRIIGTTDIDPMAGGIVACPVGLGNEADAFALQAEGDDFALELVPGFLEGADVCHVTSPWLCEPATIAASMAICRPKAIDDAPISGQSAAEDGGVETFLSREEWANRGPRAFERGAANPGEESLSPAIAAQAIEAEPSFGQINPSRRHASPV